MKEMNNDGEKGATNNVVALAKNPRQMSMSYKVKWISTQENKLVAWHRLSQSTHLAVDKAAVELSSQYWAGR